MAQGAGITFEVLFFDEDVLGLQFSASNGRFAASTQVTVARDALVGLADEIRGFPSHAEDQREVSYGQLESSGQAGGARLRFHAHLGNVLVSIYAREGAGGSGDRPVQEATFDVPIEAAAVDHFVLSIGSMPVHEGAAVTLRG